MATAYIGLGSNLDDPAIQLDKAIAALGEHPDIQSVKESPRYRSTAIGPGEQPDYINSCARLQTTLEPEQLLDALQAVENQQGRVREVRWGARTLDLDLLVYDQQLIDSERLQVPHPRLAERRFVLQPLCDLQPDLQLPTGITAAEQLKACQNQQITPIN